MIPIQPKDSNSDPSWCNVDPINQNAQGPPDISLEEDLEDYNNK